jgi:membrane protein YdbS with pleckstrin-like domain
MDDHFEAERDAMLSDAQQNHLARLLMTMRIIAGALCLGVCVLAGVVLMLERRQVEEPVLAFVALLVSVACVLAAAIVPRMMTGTPMRESSVGHSAAQSEASPDSDELNRVTQIMGIYQTRLIVSMALLEGAAFFNLVAYLIEGQVVNVAVAFVLLVLMMIQFPSRRRVEDWVEAELRDSTRMLNH